MAVLVVKLKQEAFVKGDPLSPFLFILVGEVLIALVDNFYIRGLYEGFVVGKGNIHVSIL